MIRRLHNYLRKYRKRSGLTQHEVALILGGKNASQISRYEHLARMPSLEMAFAFKHILQAESVDKLFAGLDEQVKEFIDRRRATLPDKWFDPSTGRWRKKGLG